MKRETGSLSLTFPSSTSIRMATPVTGLVIDAIAKIVSFCIGWSASISIRPWASKWATRPRRATTVTAPEICFAAIARSTTWVIRSSRSDDIPV